MRAVVVARAAMVDAILNVDASAITHLLVAVGAAAIAVIAGVGVRAYVAAAAAIVWVVGDVNATAVTICFI